MTLLCVLALKRLLAAGQALSSKTSSNIAVHSLYDMGIKVMKVKADVLLSINLFNIIHY